MDIINSAFVKSATSLTQIPEEKLSEFAFIGRSNVGKSSLINSLCRRRGLARVSATPGKTALINYFKIAIKSDLIRVPAYFVDLPGYGYARTSKTNRELWSGFINSYINKSLYLKTVFFLIDARLPAQKNDLEANKWLADSGHEIVMVLTKTDKLTKNQLAVNRKNLVAAFSAIKTVCYSTVTAAGRDELISHIYERIQNAEEF